MQRKDINLFETLCFHVYHNTIHFDTLIFTPKKMSDITLVSINFCKEFD